MAHIRGKRFDVRMPDGTKETYDERDWRKDEESNEDLITNSLNEEDAN